MNRWNRSERRRVGSQTSDSATEHPDVFVPLEQNGSKVAISLALLNQFVRENRGSGQKVRCGAFHKAIPVRGVHQYAHLLSRHAGSLPGSPPRSGVAFGESSSMGRARVEETGPP